MMTTMTIWMGGLGPGRPVQPSTETMTYSDRAFLGHQVQDRHGDDQERTEKNLGKENKTKPFAMTRLHFKSVMKKSRVCNRFLSLNVSYMDRQQGQMVLFTSLFCQGV